MLSRSWPSPTTVSVASQQLAATAVSVLNPLWATNMAVAGPERYTSLFSPAPFPLPQCRKISTHVLTFQPQPSVLFSLLLQPMP